MDQNILVSILLMLIGAIVATTSNMFIMIGGIVLFWSSLVYVIVEMIYHDK